MAIQAPPDWIRAFVLHLEDEAQITAYTHTGGTQRISPVLQKNWAMPKRAITLRAVGGTADTWVPLLQPRLEITCWAAQQFEAMALSALVHAYLVVPDHSRRTDFTIDGCCVADVQTEMWPLPMIDQETKWPVVIGRYRPMIYAVPMLAPEIT